MQLRFASFVVVNLRRDFHPQDRAHAGRTMKSPGNDRGRDGDAADLSAEMADARFPCAWPARCTAPIGRSPVPGCSCRMRDLSRDALRSHRKACFLPRSRAVPATDNARMRKISAEKNTGRTRPGVRTPAALTGPGAAPAAMEDAFARVRDPLERCADAGAVNG